MPRKRIAWRLGLAGALVAAAAALALVLTAGGAQHDKWSTSKFAGGDPDAAATSADTPGEGPIGGYEAYLSAEKTYPANVIPPAVVKNAENTFNKIAKQGDPQGNNHWNPYVAQQNSIQPGVLSFSGATTATATRITALVVGPTCVPGNCRLWAGTAGGGVWRTNDALAASPAWTWLDGGLALNSVGTLVADPNDSSGNTLYLAPARRTAARRAASPASASTNPRTAATAGRSCRTRASATRRTRAPTPATRSSAGRSARSSSTRRTRSTSSPARPRPCGASHT